MERLTFAPLIQHLRQEEDFYAEIYKGFAFQKRTLDSNLFTHWLLHCAEPVVQQTYALDAASLPRVFQAYFLTILKWLNQKRSNILDKEAKTILKLGTIIPKLILESPDEILTALFQAAQHIQKHQKGQVSEWIRLLTGYAPMCVRTSELLQLGRLCAWICGVAHLRERAKEAFNFLPKDIIEKLQVDFPNVEIILHASWTISGKPTFKKAIGNFIGYDSVFIQPPVLTRIEDHIFVTDGKNNYALFADDYGAVFLEQQVYPAKQIQKEVSNVGFPNAAVPFEDITSTALQNNTLFITRASSHHVLVYAI